jgi:hypothetical protein
MEPNEQVPHFERDYIAKANAIGLHIFLKCDDDQRADAAIEKAGLEAGLNREQLEAALKYTTEHKWIAETNKAAWSVLTQAGIDAAKNE